MNCQTSIDHGLVQLFSSIKSVSCHEGKGMKGKPHSPGGFDALTPQGILFLRRT